VAGIEATNRALDICLAQRIDIRLASVPEGKDPCDFILAAGREKFEQLLETAVDVFQFKWNRLLEKFDNDDTLTGRRQAIEEYLQTIATGLQAGNVPVIDLGLMINQISKIIGLDNKQINAELNGRIKRLERAAGHNNRNRKVLMDYGKGRFAAAQREVLEVLLNEPNLYDIAKEKISADMFEALISRQIAGILFEILGSDADTSLRGILARTESVELSNCMMELAQAGEEKGNFKARLDAALDTIEHHQIRARNSRVETVDDQRKYLRRVYKNTGRENPHSVGMV
jgi:DNA primase